MDHVFWKWLVATLVIFLVGSLLHFVYNWSGKKKWVALLAAVNESTWEHLKLALLPTFGFLGIEAIIRGVSVEFLVAAAGCLLAIVLVIPLLFYGYRVFAKHSILPVDIGIFLIGVAASQGAYWWLLGSGVEWPIWMCWLSGIMLVVIFLGYLLFTFWPPKIFLFRDPVCGGYGVHTGCGCRHRRKMRRKSK